MTEKISIIVPVYNVEKYVGACIDSILAQTYRNFELILINDGSTDNSLSICQEKSDERIVLVSKENGGSSSARNAGLECATGAYITFVDSDDRVHPQYLEKLLSACKRYRADASVCGYMKNETACMIDPDAGDTVFQGDDLGAALISKKAIGVIVWGKLFTKDAIGGNHFPEGRINEDDLFSFQVLSACNRVVKINEALYYYTVNTFGVTYGKFDKKRIDILPICLERLKVIEQRWPKQLPRALYNAACSFIDVHIDYVRFHKTGDDEFTSKLLSDREDLYRFFLAHWELLPRDVTEKIPFYYKNYGKILLIDRVRYARYAVENMVKRIARRFRHA